MQENRTIWHDTQKQSTVKINMIGWRRGINHKLWGAKGEQQVNAIEATPRTLYPQISSPTLYNSKLIFNRCLNCFCPTSSRLTRLGPCAQHWRHLFLQSQSLCGKCFQKSGVLQCLSYRKQIQASAFIVFRTQSIIQKWFFAKPCGMIRPPFNSDKNSPTGAMAVPGVILNPYY